MFLSIGDRIKHRREEMRMSQEELAAKLGYKSRSSINKIELNQRNLTQRKIKAIADALETTPSYIMGWDDEPPAPPPNEHAVMLNDDESHLVTKYKRLEPTYKNVVHGTVDTLLKTQETSIRRQYDEVRFVKRGV